MNFSELTPCLLNVGVFRVSLIFWKAERMDLMCKCQRQEQQVADLRRLVDEIAKLESGAPDAAASGGGGGGGDNWETQSGCSDLSGVSCGTRQVAPCVCRLRLVNMFCWRTGGWCPCLVCSWVLSDVL